jgi:hypothetical protein
MNNIMGHNKESLIGEYFLRNGFSYSARDKDLDYDELPSSFRQKLSKLRDAAQELQKELKVYGL